MDGVIGKGSLLLAVEELVEIMGMVRFAERKAESEPRQVEAPLACRQPRDVTWRGYTC
jgi:hypothetical protein